MSTRDKGQDTENRLAQLRQFVATQGWTIAHEYIDRATGKHADREQFQQMFHDAMQRRWDMVLFWSLDRFSREGVRETLNHLERLTGYGVGWRSFAEQYLDSCGIFKDAVLSILATVAKQERVRFSERTRAGLDRAKRQGRTPGRPKRVFRRDDVVGLRDEERMAWRRIATTRHIPVMTAVDGYRTENGSAAVVGDGNGGVSVVPLDAYANDRKRTVAADFMQPEILERCVTCGHDASDWTCPMRIRACAVAWGNIPARAASNGQDFTGPVSSPFRFVGGAFLLVDADVPTR